MKIRVSPSGPFIDNSDGGDLEFGDGARLRLSEATSVIGGSLAIPTSPGATIGTELGAGVVMLGTLAAPKANLKYRATLLLDVMCQSTGGGGDVTLFIDTSSDGSTWVERAKNIHHVGGGTGEDGDANAGRQIRVDMTLRTGTAVEVVTGTSATLRVRGRVASSNPLILADSLDTGGAVGTALIQLEELF